MTLIFALACTDGVVFASDSQETTETSCKPIRTTTQKIKRFGTQNLWAASGVLNIIHEVESVFNSPTKNCICLSLTNCKNRERILQHVLNIRKRELDRHRTLHGEGKEKDADAYKADIIMVGYNKKPII